MPARDVDPLRIPPNAASRTNDRLWECIQMQDWDALRTLCAPVAWEDRRRLVRLSGDCEMVVANCQLIARAGTHRSSTLLATAGDRLALHRQLWTGAPKGQVWESEILTLVEVDAEGRMVACVDFDADDLRAASVELLERQNRSEAAASLPAALLQFGRTLLDHDLARVRAVLPPEFYVDDHRRTGFGRLETADEYMAALAALLELSPDVASTPLYVVATAEHGTLTVGHTFGTLTSGGRFESVWVALMLMRGERPIGMELFEVENLDCARARLEELRPNAARKLTG
jgi:hypothetical protein